MLRDGCVKKLVTKKENDINTNTKYTCINVIDLKNNS